MRERLIEKVSEVREEIVERGEREEGELGGRLRQGWPRGFAGGRPGQR